MKANMEVLQQTLPWRPSHWPFRVSDRSGALLRWTARVWLLAVTTIFTVMATRGGIPEPLDTATWEVTAQLAIFGLVIFGELVAWRWQAAGASVITIGAVALGVLSAIEYEPRRALLVTLAFFLPAFLYWLDWQRTRSLQAIVLLAAITLSLLGAGGFIASQVYASYNGPTHPASATVAPPITLVEWIWSGAPTENSIRVNAALTRDSDEVYLVISKSASLDRAMLFGPAIADTGTNNRIIALTATGLKPATRYHYAILANGQLDRSRKGTFTTFERRPFSFTFAVGSCARTGSNGQVYDAIREADPLFYLVTGDLFYENIDKNDPARYRDAYEETLTSPAQAALYRGVPTVYTWDDHDFGPNDADETSPSRQAAWQVYRQIVPHFPLASSSDSGPIYHAFSVGRVRFIMTDSRSQKSPADQPDGPSKSMLGEEQKAWFKRELLAANGKYPLIVWVTSVPWIGEASDGADSWAGYATERQELADFIADNHISGLMMLAGDAHMTAIDDGTNSDYSTTQAGGFPVFHAGALDRRGSYKGGPYSVGAKPGGGQFGLVTVTDVGGPTITVTLSGRNYKSETTMQYTFSVPASD